MGKTFGGCQCGGVRFYYEGPYTDVGYCHCSLCRQQSGSAFATYMEVPEDRFHVAEGRDLLVRYGSTDRLDRYFCRNCGVTLYSTHRSFPGCVYISVGMLDSDEGIEPTHHQFVASKAKWYDIADALPQAADWPE
ncbi:MAG: GFA family protein [Woeseiaceae bacterium]|nr:GFA family protein [Woeseiaceae bacterium]